MRPVINYGISLLKTMINIQHIKDFFVQTGLPDSALSRYTSIMEDLTHAQETDRLLGRQPMPDDLIPGIAWKRLEDELVSSD